MTFLTRDPSLATRRQRICGCLALLAFVLLVGLVPN
jgi:hypothetical protein